MPYDSDERELDRDTSRPDMHRSLSNEEAYNFFGITYKQWHAIRADVLRGARRFWKKRGLVEPVEFILAQRTSGLEAKAKAKAMEREQNKA